MIRALLAAAALVAIPAGGVFAADSDCLGKSCNDAAVVEISFNVEADNDVFAMWEMAPEICETARGLDADGLSGQHIADAAVDVFTETALISTPEGAMYLRGMVRGCLAT